MKITVDLSTSASKPSAAYEHAELIKNLKKLKLGDACIDDDHVVILDGGYFRLSGATLSIAQIGIDGKPNWIQLNGPHLDALRKALR